MDADEFEEAGLYEPMADNAMDRLELLRFLAAAGVTLERMQEVYRQAGRTGLLEGLFSDLGARPLAPATLLTPREVAGQAGVAVEQVLRLRRLAGLAEMDADHPCLPPEAVEDVAALRIGDDIFGEEICSEFVRVIGAAAAAVADAAIALVVDARPGSSEESVGSELAMLKTNLAATAAVPYIPIVFGHWVELHMVADSERRWVAGSDAWGAATHSMTVGFVDLVDSTGWTQRVDPATRASALASFERAAWTAASRHGGRIIKFVGDEAMFVARHPTAAVEIARELAAEVAHHPHLPEARGAVGWGEVIRRGGDYFGSVVNAVSRATKEAPPGRVVVTDELARRLPKSVALTEIGERRVKGLDEPLRLFVLDTSDPAEQ